MDEKGRELERQLQQNPEDQITKQKYLEHKKRVGEYAYYFLLDRGYDHCSTILLLGPKQKDWGNYCKSFAAKAALNVMRKNEREDDTRPVFGSDVFKEILKSIKMAGYAEVDFPSAGFFTDCSGGFEEEWESGFGLTPHDAKLIAQYNKEANKRSWDAWGKENMEKYQNRLARGTEREND